MLLSTCPNCNAKFRVAPEQLNVRQGHVMCGRCRHVFNAFESLKRVEDEPAPETIDYSIVAGKNSVDDTRLPAAPDLVAELDVADDLGEPPAIELADVPQAPVAQSALDARIDEDIDADTDESAAATVSATVPAAETDTATQEDMDRTIPQAPGVAETAAGGSESVERRTAEAGAPATDVDATAATIAIPESFRPATANPLIAGKLPQQRSASAVWGWLVAVAALVLIVQLTFVYLGWIFQHVPQARPAFTAVCDVLGCVVPLSRDVAAIKVESSDLVEQPGKPGRILLSAIVANRSALKQSFPVLEIVLTDAKETVIASRVLQPSAYLGRLPSEVEGIAPNTELYINLNLDLSGGATASGYAVRVFYP